MKKIWRGKGIAVRFWLWRKLFAGKQVLVPVVFLGFAAAAGIFILIEGTSLWKEMAEPLEVYVMAENMEMKDAYQDKISDFSCIARQVRILEWQDYSAEVTVVSLEYDYLMEKYKDCIELPWSDTMPYVILTEPVLASMRTKKLEHLEYEDAAGFAGEYFQFSDEEGNTEDIRIWGVIEGEKAIVYTVLSDTDIAPAQKQYLLDVSSGFGLQTLLDELEKSGFSVISDEFQDVRALAAQWQEDKKKLIFAAVPGCLALFCGLLAAYYQGKIWMLKNRDFINYMDQFKL